MHFRGKNLSQGNYSMIQLLLDILLVHPRETKTYVHTNIYVHKCHSSISHNSQKVETTQMSITDEWNKLNVENAYDGIFSNKKY